MTQEVKHQIVIVGGGAAGITVAAQLLNKNSNFDIAIIEPSDKHYYQPAWTLVGGGVYQAEATVKKEQEVIPDSVTWIKDYCDRFEPESNKVITRNQTQITYDYLVVCPGIQIDWDLIPGLKETLGKNGVCSNYAYEQAPKT